MRVADVRAVPVSARSRRSSTAADIRSADSWRTRSRRGCAGHLYHADDVVAHSLRVEDGLLLPPAGPGLGVELDEERLARYAAAS